MLQQIAHAETSERGTAGKRTLKGQLSNELLGRVALLHRADGSKLLRVVAKGVRAVLRVVDLAHQAWMRDRDVIALQIVVDIHLPVATDHVVAALGPPIAGGPDLDLGKIDALLCVGHACKQRCGADASNRDRRRKP